MTEPQIYLVIYLVVVAALLGAGATVAWDTATGDTGSWNTILLSIPAIATILLWPLTIPMYAVVRVGRLIYLSAINPLGGP